MKCKDVMTKYLKMCRPESTAKSAVQIMKELNCGVIPVVSDTNELKGIVTDRDIVLYTVMNDKEPEHTILNDFMTKDVITCNEDDNVDTAIEKMKEFKVRRLPIVDNENKVIGIISLGDIAVVAHEEHETFDALENISKPISSAK